MESTEPAPVSLAPPPLLTSISPHQLRGIGVTTSLESQSHGTPLVSHGQEWTRSLVHLAKAAELKKHVLELQLHTAHVLSAHASLDEKNKTLQDLNEQRNRLESERSRLIDSLRQINEDRERLDRSYESLDKDCTELRNKIQRITDNEYTSAKNTVDSLRKELGHPPLPSLQSILDQRSSTYLTNRRLQGPPTTQLNISSSESPRLQTRGAASPSSRSPEESTPPAVGQRDPENGEPFTKRPRGRPKGSKNKPKAQTL